MWQLSHCTSICFRPVSASWRSCGTQYKWLHNHSSVTVTLSCMLLQPGRARPGSAPFQTSIKYWAATSPDGHYYCSGRTETNTSSPFSSFSDCALLVTRRASFLMSIHYGWGDGELWANLLPSRSVARTAETFALNKLLDVIEFSLLCQSSVFLVWKDRWKVVLFVAPHE